MGKLSYKKLLPLLYLFSTLFIFIGLFLLLKNTFFFHDEWTFLYKIITSPIKFLFEPHNGHFMPLFNAIYFLEYKFFGLNYPLYQFVLLIFHFVNAYILYSIVCYLTKNQNLGILSFFLFIVNSVYWETLFASATLNTVLCLLLIGASITLYLKYQKRKKQRYLLFSGLCSLLSSYAWGAGLFFPLLFLMIVFTKKMFREKIKIKEFLVYSIASVISIGGYLVFAKPLVRTAFNFKKITVFTLTAIKWIILSFYTTSPGKLKLFAIVVVFLFLVVYSVFKNKRTRKECFRIILKNKYMLFFSLTNFIYIYILSAISRYQIDMELAKSSRYTYLPLFFLIIINMIFLNSLIPLLPKRCKLLLFGYFIFLLVNHVYFFRIYYRNWTETISGPNKRIFRQITQAASRKELEKIKFPSTFHSFFKAEDIYFIYQHSVESKEDAVFQL